jgi:hypothetical protein
MLSVTSWLQIALIHPEQATIVEPQSALLFSRRRERFSWKKRLHVKNSLYLKLARHTAGEMRMIDLVRWTIAGIIFSIIAVLLVACGSTAAPIQTDEPSQVAVGTSKVEILEKLGHPDEREIIVKQQESIWGPPEEWWHTLDLGDRVEIWSYLFPQGTLQLYFVRGSETVDHKAFIDKDIVY